jgi:hydantoinase/carbamoylase family amidase
MRAGSTFDRETVARNLEAGIETLARFSLPGPGITRLSFTPEYLAALRWLEGEFEALGFRVDYDPVGNFLARNVAPGERCVALGSHVDSVPHGGRFDGTAGVLCALEVARAAPDTPLKVFSFVEEEGVRFGGLLGSRAVAGLVSAEELEEHRDDEGVSFYDAARGAGFDPDRVAECQESLRGVERYLEVHIEQGRVLEEAGEEIGVVEAISGAVHAVLEIEGRADHAGATPMGLRSDAGLTAAEVVVELDHAAREAGGDTVGTAGRIGFRPGAINVIPGHAEVSLDVRAPDEAKRDAVLERVLDFGRERAASRGQSVRYREHLHSSPTPMDGGVVEGLVGACERVGASYRRMTSGAGHDAMMVARRVPAGMLFVPSRDGVSHAPEEFTEYRHLATAVAVLLEGLGIRSQ